MRFGQQQEGEASIGLAGLIDVVLLLLIFFLVTTSFAERKIALELPDAENTEPSEGAKLVVTLTKDGGIAVDEEPVSEEQLELRLQAAAGPEAELEVRADDAVNHGRVVDLLDVAREYGITNIGIAVSGGS